MIGILVRKLDHLDFICYSELDDVIWSQPTVLGSHQMGLDDVFGLFRMFHVMVDHTFMGVFQLFLHRIEVIAIPLDFRGEAM